jgi:hypothetical protein
VLLRTPYLTVKYFRPLPASCNVVVAELTWPLRFSLAPKKSNVDWHDSFGLMTYQGQKFMTDFREIGKQCFTAAKYTYMYEWITIFKNWSTSVTDQEGPGPPVHIHCRGKLWTSPSHDYA